MPAIYHTPTGPANLAALFPSINWNDVKEYYVEVLDAGSAVIATTPKFVVNGCEEDLNISFINYLGQVDSIPFSVTVEHDTKSTTFQRSTTSPLQRAFSGNTRLQVKSTDNFTGVCLLQENQLQLIEEFLDSPLAWFQLKSVQGLVAGYIPILITDQSVQTLKDTERYSYEVTVKFSLSHERIIISN